MSISVTLTDAPTPTPARNSANFRTEADSYVDWQANTFVAEMNTVIKDLNDTIQNLFVGTSNSSVAIGIGPKSFTVAEENLAFGIGNNLRIADTANPTARHMEGIVTSYTKSTKQLIVTVPSGSTYGSGTVSGWTMTLAPPMDFNRVVDWSSMTGAVSLPFIVEHASEYWALSENISDVTAEEPGISEKWNPLYYAPTKTTISASQTGWSPDQGSRVVMVEALAGGGAGGGGSDQYQGGGGGEYINKIFLVSELSAPVDITIGAGGVGALGSGGNGGNTSFGAYLTAVGGYGGYYSEEYGKLPRTFGFLDPSTVEATAFVSCGCGGGRLLSGRDTINGGGGGGGSAPTIALGGISVNHGDGGRNDGFDGEFPSGGGGGNSSGVGGAGGNGVIYITQW